jgi:hypothetical protein
MQPKIGEVWQCSRQHTHYGRVLIIDDSRAGFTGLTCEAREIKLHGDDGRARLLRRYLIPRDGHFFLRRLRHGADARLASGCTGDYFPSRVAAMPDLLTYLSTPRKPKPRNLSRSTDRHGKPVYQASVEIYDFKTYRKSNDDVELEAWLRRTEAAELAKVVYWL